MPDDGYSQNVAYANQSDQAQKALASIASLIRDADNLLPIIRLELRGEASITHDDGSVEYIQMYKPLFVRIDPRTEEPIKRTITFKDGSLRECYISNDEAIEEILSIIKFMGINNITRISNIDVNIIMDDLHEFECKLATLLALKQKKWGIDKEMLPMIQTKLKTLVQDARLAAANGTTIKAIQKTVTRIENLQEGDRSRRKSSPYG